MEPAEEILLKTLFASEKANNPYYSQHLKHSKRVNLRGLYSLSDFLPLIHKTLEEAELLIENSAYIERIGTQLISLTAFGMAYGQKTKLNVADEDKIQPMGFIK